MLELLVRHMRRWVDEIEFAALGVPVNAGPRHFAQDQAPAGLCEAGVVERWRCAGEVWAADGFDVEYFTFHVGPLAVAVLVGLVLNAGFGWWWADPAAALVVVGYAVKEAAHLLGPSARPEPGQA